MATVICHGCGQAFGVPEGYARNKIQCPGCGVICPVPADEGKRAAAPAAPRAPAGAREAPRPQPAALEEEAAAWLSAAPAAPAPLVEEPVPVQERAAPAAEPEPPTRKPAETPFLCRRCGSPVRRQRECPVCDAGGDESLPVDPEREISTGQARGRSRAPGVGLAPHSMELDEPETLGVADDEDDPSPYLLADREMPRCPKCHKDLTADDAVVCVKCGFNLRTRKKATRTYEPIDRSWESDMPLSTRLMWLGAFQVFHLLLTVFASLGGFATPFLVAWWPLTAILCFVLGTYERVGLTRDNRGRVTLIKRWRFCFVPMTPQVVEVRGFEGVVNGRCNDTVMWDWLVCVMLLCVGVIPAFIWWYNAIYKSTFHVALTLDHGHAEVYVYRGRNEEQMHDITRVLCDAAGLRNIT
jgi:hypothetical protein